MTGEPCYNKDLKTIQITLLYQVSCYIKVQKKNHKTKELELAKSHCYKEDFVIFNLTVTRFYFITFQFLISLTLQIMFELHNIKTKILFFKCDLQK